MKLELKTKSGKVIILTEEDLDLFKPIEITFTNSKGQVKPFTLKVTAKESLVLN